MATTRPPQPRSRSSTVGTGGRRGSRGRRRRARRRAAQRTVPVRLSIASTRPLSLTRNSELLAITGGNSSRTPAEVPSRPLVGGRAASGGRRAGAGGRCCSRRPASGSCVSPPRLRGGVGRSGSAVGGAVNWTWGLDTSPGWCSSTKATAPPAARTATASQDDQDPAPAPTGGVRRHPPREYRLSVCRPGTCAPPSGCGPRSWTACGASPGCGWSAAPCGTPCWAWSRGSYDVVVEGDAVELARAPGGRRRRSTSASGPHVGGDDIATTRTRDLRGAGRAAGRDLGATPRATTSRVATSPSTRWRSVSPTRPAPPGLGALDDLAAGVLRVLHDRLLPRRSDPAAARRPLRGAPRLLLRAGDGGAGGGGRGGRGARHRVGRPARRGGPAGPARAPAGGAGGARARWSRRGGRPSGVRAGPGADRGGRARGGCAHRAAGRRPVRSRGREHGFGALRRSRAPIPGSPRSDPACWTRRPRSCGPRSITSRSPPPSARRSPWPPPGGATWPSAWAAATSPSEVAAAARGRPARGARRRRRRRRAGIRSTAGLDTYRHVRTGHHRRRPAGRRPVRPRRGRRAARGARRGARRASA